MEETYILFRGRFSNINSNNELDNILNGNCQLLFLTQFLRLYSFLPCTLSLSVFMPLYFSVSEMQEQTIGSGNWRRRRECWKKCFERHQIAVDEAKQQIMVSIFYNKRVVLRVVHIPLICEYVIY